MDLAHCLNIAFYLCRYKESRLFQILCIHTKSVFDAMDKNSSFFPTHMNMKSELHESSTSQQMNLVKCLKGACGFRQAWHFSFFFLLLS